MQIYWIAALAFGIVIALFAVQNAAPITLRFLWLSVEDVPVSVIVLICATLGALVTSLFGLGREVRVRMARRSTGRTVRSQEQRIAELETTIQQLEREKAELQGKVDGRRAALEGRAILDESIEPLPPARPPLQLPPSERGPRDED